jgi:hypothetical protein
MILDEMEAVGDRTDGQDDAEKRIGLARESPVFVVLDNIKGIVSEPAGAVPRQRRIVPGSSEWSRSCPE